MTEPTPRRGTYVRLTAVDPTAVVDDRRVLRIQHWLLELLPATRCDVERGPVVITAARPPDDLVVGDLAPGVRAAVEEIIGCAVEVVVGTQPSP